VFSIFLDAYQYVRRLDLNGLCDTAMGCAQCSLHTERSSSSLRLKMVAKESEVGIYEYDNWLMIADYFRFTERIQAL
jgi:hypothetical protein